MNQPADIFPRQAGFSLLEVLVAFAILAISIGVLMQVFSNSMRAASVTRHYSNALIIAESQLAKAFSESPLEAGSDSGIVDDFYHWDLSVSPYLPPVEGYEKALFLPFQASIMVSWGEGSNQQRSITLDTLNLGRKQ